MHIKQANHVIFAFVLVLFGLVMVASPVFSASGEWTKVYGAVLNNQNGGIQLQEEYTFGSFNNHWSNFFTRLTNGEYIFSAFSSAKGSLYSSKINRLAKTGKLLSTKAVHLSAVSATPDGGYVGINVVKAGVDSNKDAKITYSLIKYKKNGQLEWKKVITGKIVVKNLSLITVTTNGEYVVAGSWYGMDSNNDDGMTPYVAKFSKDGNLVWESVVAIPAEFAQFNSLRPTVDGGVVISGHKKNLTSNSNIAWVAKIDSDSNLLWENTFGCEESATYAEETSEGNIVVASNVRTGYSTDPKSWNYETERLFSAGRISTFDAEGNLIGENVQQSLFSDDSQVQGCLVKEGTQDNYVENPVSFKINMVKPTSDGGLFLVGTRSTGIKSAQQKDRVWVRKLDAEGAVLWDKTFTDAGGGNQFGLTGFQTSPTLYTVVGTKKNGQRVVRSFVGK